MNIKVKRRPKIVNEEDDASPPPQILSHGRQTVVSLKPVGSHPTNTADFIDLEPELKAEIIKISMSDGLTHAQALKRYRDRFSKDSDQHMPHISSLQPKRKSNAVRAVPFKERARKKVNPRHLPIIPSQPKEKKKKEKREGNTYIGG